MIFLGLFGTSKIGLAIPDPTIVSLSPTFSREVVGNNVFVNVMVSNVADLHSWEFKLFYETKSLNAIDVTEGQFLKSADPVGTDFEIVQINNAYNSTHGLVWASCFIVGTNSATGSGVLATVEFRGSGGGLSHMALDYSGSTYPVNLWKIDSNVIPCTTTGADVFIAGPETAQLDVNIDVGSLYFAGEQVQWYVMTTYQGILVTPTHINAIMQNPNGESVSLTPQTISTGFCKVMYTLPQNAPSGTWTAIVEADYFTDSIQAYGTSFKTCLLSSTLSDLQMHVTAIEGSTATIQTALGTMQGTITSINNNVATIRTDVGTVKLDISTIKTNTTPNAVDWTTISLYVSMALIVSIAVVLVVLYLYMRARFRSETTPS